MALLTPAEPTALNPARHTEEVIDTPALQGHSQHQQSRRGRRTSTTPRDSINTR